MEEPIRIERHAAVWEIILDRPKANAIDSATSRALGQAFIAFRDEPAARVAILTGGGGKFFSAGWGFKAAAARGAERPSRPRALPPLPPTFHPPTPLPPPPPTLPPCRAPH